MSAPSPDVHPLRRMFGRLTEPSAAVADPVARRKARLLAALLLAMPVVFGAIDTTFVAIVPGHRPPWYGYVVMAIAYAVGRSRHYHVGAWLLVGLFPLVGFVHIAGGAGPHPSLTLNYLVVSPLLAALLFEMRAVAMLGLVTVGGTAAMPLISDRVDSWTEVMVPLSTNAMAAVLALAYMQLRNAVERDRQAALRESEERLRLALEASQMGIWDWSVSDDRLTVTPDVERVLGVEPGSLTTRAALVERIHPEDRAHVGSVIRQMQADPGSDQTATYRIVRPDGSVRWLESRGRMLPGEDRAIGTLGDITEHRTLEEQLRQAQKMEAVGRLAGGVAHDFNNLLMVIVGHAELLRGKQPNRHLDQITKAARSASTLTRRLLAFGRKTMLHPEALDLREAVRSTADMAQRLIGEDIKVRLDLPDGLSPVLMDGSQLEHVVLNLVTNARDAMPEGGTLTLQARPGPEGSDTTLLEVCDTGMGIDPALREHIFEPFFTTKQVGRGTGLGLPMVYGLVTQSGGEVEVDSEPGRGTTVRLRLPNAPVTAPSEAAAPEPAATIRGGSAVVLVVEDDPGVLGVCEEALEEAGFSVLTADSAGEARRRSGALAAPVDVLLCDWRLPDARGHQVAQQVEARHVLFMTGHAGDTHEAHPPDDRTIHKPFTPRELRERIERLLQPSRSDPPRADARELTG